MPKDRIKSLRKHLPSQETVTRNRALQVFGERIRDPDLWHFNRRSVAIAVAIGIFCAFLPMPFEMIPAAAIAIAWRANLPLSLAGVWISNPLTWVPLYTPGYLFGAKLLGISPIPLDQITLLHLGGHLAALWLGNLLIGLVLAPLSYFVVRWLWVINVRRTWEVRRRKRAIKKAAKHSKATKVDESSTL